MPKVVIVGAGLAGLSAAQKLKESNFGDLLVVEAKSRAGGRIESIFPLGDSRIDLGAQWLHGERSNPVYDWLRGLDCIEGPEEEEVEFEGMFRTQDGISPSENVISRILELLMDAKATLYKTASMLNNDCRPVDIYRRHINLELDRCCILKQADPNLVESVIRWFELYEMIDNSCENIQSLSMKAYSDWTDFDEGKLIKLKGGWQNVVNKLAEMVGSKSLILNNPVQQIDYSGSSITVKLADKTVIDCDHVILTQSIGCLKRHSVNFIPEIDPKRARYVDGIGFGVANKIFLQFDRPFLVKEKGLKLLWMKDGCSNHNLQVPEWTKYITGFDLVSGSPNILLGWIGGSGALKMEKYSEKDVADACLRLIRTFAPDKPMPRLLSVSRSRWGSDPYILGAYSYKSITSIDQDSDEIWEPIVVKDSKGSSTPRILFAGEATAKNMYATAHGAIMSGWREASRLLQLYNYS